MIENFSKEDLFIYLGYGNDKDIAVKLINKSNGLLIIDGSHGMKPDYLEDLWLYPPNLIMIAQNIKIGLSQYISSTYLVKEIEENYDELILKLSELDAEYKLTCENATSKTIVTSSKYLNYLKKYGFNVISLDDDNKALEKTINEVNEMIENGQINYIYTIENVPIGEAANTILENNSKVSKIELRKADNITGDERNNGEDYFTLLNKNLDEIKKETYK
jgi:zinc transport system substrate-binding protein